MKKKRNFSLVFLALVVAIVSYIVSGIIFKSPIKNATAPLISPVDQSFPDVIGDPAYSSIFNDKALDPTQPVQIGGSSNKQPFTGQ